MIGALGLVGGILLIVGLAGLVVPIWAIVDAAMRPSSAFSAAGSSKGMWITLILVLWIFTGIAGFVLALFYLFSIRPRVRSKMG